MSSARTLMYVPLEHSTPMVASGKSPLLEVRSGRVGRSRPGAAGVPPPRRRVPSHEVAVHRSGSRKPSVESARSSPGNQPTPTATSLLGDTASALARSRGHRHRGCQSRYRNGPEPHTPCSISCTITQQSGRTADPDHHHPGCQRIEGACMSNAFDPGSSPDPRNHVVRRRARRLVDDQETFRPRPSCRAFDHQPASASNARTASTASSR